jgi:hypothetical protein
VTERSPSWEDIFEGNGAPPPQPEPRRGPEFLGILEPPDPDPEAPTAPRLELRTIPELRARVAAQGPRQWLARGIIPAGQYGLHGGPPKAQKTWNAGDLCVSVASGTDWLGHFPVDVTGPVIMFAGEGGEGTILRRLDAIAEAKGLDADELRIAVCARAPHLRNLDHQAQLHRAFERYQPVLVVVDPFYLAARGANLRDLYDMGGLLEVPQHLCEAAGASLLVVHHFNRNREGRGAERFSGAGPAEWGRFLIGASVISRYTDPDTQATAVTTELDIIGGEIPDQTFRVHRTLSADNPADLNSRLRYQVQVSRVENEAPTIATMPEAKPAAQRVHAVLAADPGSALTVKEIGDRLAATGHPLKARTIQDALKSLGPLVDGMVINAHGATQWMLVNGQR